MASRLGRTLEVPSEVGGLTFGLQEGDLSVTLTDVYLYEPGTRQKAVIAPKLRLELEPLALTSKQLDVQRAIFERPTIRLFRGKDGRIRLLGVPFSDFFRRPGEATKGWKVGPFSLEKVKELVIQEGRIELVDLFPPRHPPSPISAVVNLTLQGLSPVHPWSFAGKGVLLPDAADAPRPTFQVVGHIGQVTGKRPPAHLALTQAELTLKDFKPELIQEIFPSVKPLHQVRGRVSLTLTYAGKSFQEFQTRGKVDLSSLVWDAPQLFPEPVHLSDLLLSYEGQRQGDRLRATASLEGERLIGQGAFTLGGPSREGRRLEMALSFPPLVWEEAKPYLPWNAMSRGLSHFLADNLSGGRVVSLELKAAGRPEALLQVEQALRTGLLSAQVAFEDLTYRFSGSFPPVTEMKGLAHLEQGRLHLSHLQGVSEGLRMTGGKGMLLLSEGHQPLDLTVEAQGDLGAYLPTIGYDTLPPRLSVFRRLRGLEGQGELLLLLNGPTRGGDYPEHFQGRLTLLGGRFSATRFPLPFSQLHGTIAFNSQVLHTSSLQGIAGSSPFSLQGTVAGYLQPRPEINLGVGASLTAPDLKELLPAGLLSGLASARPLDLQLSLQGTPEVLHFRQELDLTPASYATFGGEKPSRLSNRLFLEGVWRREEENQRLEIQKLLFLLPFSEVRGAGYVLLQPRPYLELSLEVPRFGLPELVQLVYREEGWRGDAHLRGTLQLKGPWKEPGGLQVAGQLELQGERLEIPQLALPLRQLQASLRFDPEGFGLGSGQLRVEDTLLSISGELLRTPQPVVHFRLSGGELNLDQLLRGNLIQESLSRSVQQGSLKRAEGEDLIRFLVRQLTENPIFRVPWEGQVDLDRLVFRNFPFQGLHIDGSLGGRGLELKDLTFKLDQGKIRLKAIFHVPPNDLPRMMLAAQAVDLNTRASFRRLGMEGDLFSGSFHLEGSVQGTGKTQDQLLKSLEGDVALELREGRIHRFSWLSRILSLMNLYQLAQARLPDLMSEGVPFDSIRGTFTIKHGVAHTKDFLLQGPAMSMSAVGDIYLYKGTLKMIVGVQPFETFEKVVGLVPFASYILLGKEKKLVVAYFRIKGRLNNPSVAPRPVDTISKSLLGIVERTLRFPMEFPSQIPILGQESFWNRVYQSWKKVYQWVKFW
ncbi:MAG: AsmA-like C-terminal domain-containing protein [Candidatus Tectomicrobia bacterium]|uniref:AsmA-like C-terminal domain-containing protein n=1 Tax=Tectimicrobiota bacterium TaxID=2528274 RepID=A0A932FYN0_UNCTE|nr:AsmA-like C-terminal domain-containing protein [Candidatus Tectomicrobia bacterium]